MCIGPFQRVFGLEEEGCGGMEKVSGIVNRQARKQKMAWWRNSPVHADDLIFGECA